MRNRQTTGNIVATAVAVAVAAIAFRLSTRYLAPPSSGVDWAMQISAAITVGIIMFVLTWGHFQDVPKTTPPASEQSDAAEHRAASDSSQT